MPIMATNISHPAADLYLPALSYVTSSLSSSISSILLIAFVATAAQIIKMKHNTYRQTQGAGINNTYIENNVMVRSERCIRLITRAKTNILNASESNNFIMNE